MNKQTNFSDQQKRVYLIGNILIAFGIVLFVIFFTSLFLYKADDMEQEIRQSLFLALGCGGSMALGIGLKSIAKNGLAGSGLLLDTEQEVKDLEPINRMKGKKLNHTLEESNINKHLEKNTIVKMRCQNCQHLNDENNNFCGNCGFKI